MGISEGGTINLISEILRVWFTTSLTLSLFVTDRIGGTKGLIGSTGFLGDTRLVDEA